jgi:hypothetical protein
MLRISTIQSISRVSLAVAVFIALNILVPSTPSLRDDIKTNDEVVNVTNDVSSIIKQFDERFSDVVKYLPTHMLVQANNDNLKEIQCMALNNYFEASVEGESGMHAVSQVVLNRTEHPDFPKTPCGVIYEKTQRKHGLLCQFSWVCQEKLPHLDHESPAWKTAVEIAHKTYVDGTIFNGLESALFYHATYVKPNWKRYQKVKQVGTHIFYELKERRA